MPTTFTEREQRVTAIRAAISENTLGTATRETIETINAWLADPLIGSAFGGSNEYEHIRSLAILHFKCAIQDEADKRNTRLSWLVIALTVASLIGTAYQVWYGYKADKRSEAESLPIAELLQFLQSQQQHQSRLANQAPDPAKASSSNAKSSEKMTK